MSAVTGTGRLALLATLLLACGVSEAGDPGARSEAGATRAPAAPPARAGFLKIVRPAPGTTVRQSFELAIETDATDIVSGLRIGVDGEPPVGGKQMAFVVILDSTTRPNGRHRISASVVTGDGRVLQDSVELLYENAPFKVVSYAMGAPSFQGGDTAWFDVRVAGEIDGLTASADFSQVDPTWRPGAEKVEAVSIGVTETTFRFSRTLPARSGVKAGSYDLPIVVRGPKGVVTSSVELTLRRRGR